jgi:hypothetical protein
MPYMKSGGIELYYEVHGEGIPIIFAHVSSPLVKYHLSVESLARVLSCLGPGEGGYGCIV